MDPIFCIPSYGRPGTIVRKTLDVLKRNSVPPESIHIYVANDAQRAEYAASVPPELYGSLRVAEIGLAAARNFILADWPLGTWICMMDDDVSEVLTLDASGGLVAADVLKVVRYGFQAASEVKCSLWGIYPVANAFFMKPVVTSDLRFCVGPMFGLINPGSGPDGISLPPYSEKEDYIRTLMAYDRDNAVIRINNVCVKTRYNVEPGGIELTGRLAREEEVVRHILARWPDRTARKKCKSRFPEIRIKKIKAPTTQIWPAPEFS